MVYLKRAPLLWLTSAGGAVRPIISRAGWKLSWMVSKRIIASVTKQLVPYDLPAGGDLLRVGPIRKKSGADEPGDYYVCRDWGPLVLASHSYDSRAVT